jgi:hypothetical protein
MTRVATMTSGSGNTVPYAGAAFDGRFVYFVPNGSMGLAPAVRYDTLSTFTADCAWETFDPNQLALPDGGVINAYLGAVFDGQYVYFAPTTPTKGAVFLRFAAKSPPSLPNLPEFHGSFY